MQGMEKVTQRPHPALAMMLVHLLQEAFLTCQPHPALTILFVFPHFCRYITTNFVFGALFFLSPQG